VGSEGVIGGGLATGEVSVGDKKLAVGDHIILIFLTIGSHFN
jgi:hypothetical protein